ncbi:type III PLP-dependent enzyme [Actinocrispum sp. NPDC049592]|uniref:type III PLP-dependent enzyme n=1 Tax=Actinocrispum sp. NPDC049592 TaxID=3154835 RepID=UPI003428DF76
MSLPADDVLALVAEVGSPFYVYDLAEVRASAARLRGALPEGARVFYSLKANPHPEVVATCLKSGLGVEVSSEGEWSSVPAGTPSSSIIYSGPGKTAAQLAEFARRWGGYVTAESLRELTQVRRLGGFAGILLRVNVTSDRRGASLTMSGRPSQFGIDDVELLRDWAVHDLSAGDIAGFQVYAMSNQPDVEVIAGAAGDALRFVRDCAELHGFRPSVLDLGGGFAAPFGRAGRSSLDGLRTALRSELDGVPAAAEAALVFESGRFLSAPAGTLYATVLDVKCSKGKRYVVLDAGVNAVAGLQASGRTLPASLDVEVAHRGSAAGGSRPVVVTGPLCTPFDVLNREIELDVAAGDIVRVPNVGAYGLSAAAVGFLSRRLPAEVVVDGQRVLSATRVTMVRGACG